MLGQSGIDAPGEEDRYRSLAKHGEDQRTGAHRSSLQHQRQHDERAGERAQPRDGCPGNEDRLLTHHQQAEGNRPADQDRGAERQQEGRRLRLCDRGVADSEQRLEREIADGGEGQHLRDGPGDGHDDAHEPQQMGEGAAAAEVGKRQERADFRAAGDGIVEREGAVEGREHDAAVIHAREESVDDRLRDHVEFGHENERNEKPVAGS